jgi:hypothetical protein
MCETNTILISMRCGSAPRAYTAHRGIPGIHFQERLGVDLS